MDLFVQISMEEQAQKAITNGDAANSDTFRLLLDRLSRLEQRVSLLASGNKPERQQSVYAGER